MNCQNCEHVNDCFFAFSGYFCGDYSPACTGPTPEQREQLERTGEAGFYELPRVPFIVLDF